MSARSEQIVLNQEYQPESLDHLSKQMMSTFECIRVHERNKVDGGAIDDPTTGSAQLTGTGNTTWSCDIEAMLVIVDGVMARIAAAADFAIHASSFLTGLVDGASCVAAIVAKNVSGTITVVAVKGTPATTGSQVAPTDAEIDTAVSDVPWVKLGECTLNRTGDTTVTESQDNSLRPILGINTPYALGDL